MFMASLSFDGFDTLVSIASLLNPSCYSTQVFCCSGSNGLSHGAPLAPDHGGLRLETERTVDATRHTRWLAATEITHDGHILVIIPVSRTKGAGFDTFPAADALGLVDSHYRHSAVAVNRACGTDLDARCLGAVNAHDGRVKAMQPHDPDA
jgi:hypothetical protein